MNELVGHKIIIYSVSAGVESRDVGILEAVDGCWLKLHKEGGEILYFSSYHIRIVKAFDPH